MSKPDFLNFIIQIPLRQSKCVDCGKKYEVYSFYYIEDEPCPKCKGRMRLKVLK